MAENAAASIDQSNQPIGHQGWADRFQESELLPIMPHDAVLSPSTKVSPVNRGKVPGRFLPRDVKLNDGTILKAGWVGWGKWTSLLAGPDDIKRWQKWGAGVGVQGRVFPGLDLDVANKSDAQVLQKLAFEILGAAPVRGRANSPRRLLMYQIADGCKPFHKIRVAWKDGDRQDAVELLGFGNYYNVEGMHPSGEPYVWDCHPCNLGVAGIPKITPAQVQAFFAGLNDHIELMGYEPAAPRRVIAGRKGASGSATERKSMDDPSRWAPTPQHVLDLLGVWPNTPDNVPTHEDFVAAMAAIKTSLGSHREDYYAYVEDWALEYPGNDDKYVRRVWESFR